jgi:hypothetical protein
MGEFNFEDDEEGAVDFEAELFAISHLLYVEYRLLPYFGR